MTSTSLTCERRRSISVDSRFHHLPLRKPLYASPVLCEARKPELVANPSKFFFSIYSSPCPPPIRATSIKIPQNTPNVPAIINVSVACMAILMSTVGFRKTVSVHIPVSIVWLPKALFIHSVAPIPATMPIYPNIVVIVTLSTIISQRIESGLAPSALRIPNSRVRSFTVISMILETPTIPLSNVKIPITQIAIRSMADPCCCCR